jgi:hypothetical protein
MQSNKTNKSAESMCPDGTMSKNGMCVTPKNYTKMIILGSIGLGVFVIGFIIGRVTKKGK